MIDQPIYHLRLVMRGCLARVTVNGFPVVAMNTRRPTSVGPPINAFLAGEGNVITIEALPAPGGPPNPLEVEIRGSVAAFADGDIVAPDAPAEIVLPIDLRRALVGKKPEFPMRALFVFDNPGPAFPALFRESEVIEDLDPLFDYAMHLRSLAAQSDVGGLVAELAPKMCDYAAAYYETEDSMLQQLRDFLTGRMFPGPMDVDFGRGDILPVPWCGGRIWELRCAPSEPLLRTQPDGEGARLEIPIYVALVNGGLKVVR
ncbi:hypothetical protein A7982_13632 [Minicystis rosea]|nr:hypothetical protein A7982_13632 [Minicystis rosea]